MVGPRPSSTSTRRGAAADSRRVALRRGACRRAGHEGRRGRLRRLAWEIVPAGALQQRRTNGGSAFAWYRLSFTMPARVGAFDTAGSTVVFEIVVDDYAEVWVDGALPRVLGQTGGALVDGFNAPNRVVLTRRAEPGKRSGSRSSRPTGPLSDPPANFIWVRSATLDFYKTPAPVGTRLDVGAREPGPRPHRPAGRPAREAGRAASPSSKARCGCRRRAPALQRPERQPHLPLVGRPRRLGLPDQERLHRRRHRRVPPAGVERPDARPRGPADHRRARQPARDAAREERRPHGAGRPLSRASG